jgi:pilus assembly protein CpaB
MSQARLAPRWRDRIASAVPGSGWRRLVLLRRLAAGLLATAALVLALAPPAPTTLVPVVVAATDLTAGGTVAAADLAVRYWPSELAPGGALPEPAAAEGQVLVGAARAGEPITDVRLAGAAARSAGPGMAAVPVRLADPGVSGLLRPGSRVDVVGRDEASGDPLVLAPDAAVLAVLPAEDGSVGSGSHGRLILVTMPRELATRVAAASVADGLAITLR